jgi:hypothetical protein
VGLLACPFCREMFEEGEAKKCPVCGMELAKFADLPPSHDAMFDEAGVPVAPEEERLPLTYLGRGKGLLAAVGLAGIVLFFLPWVQLTLPYIDARSGFDLARQKLGWVWAALVAFGVLVPTVLSRRSILQMRGARVAAAFLCAVPAMTVAILLLNPPQGGRIPVRYTWDWPIWAVLALSLVGIVGSLRLGGSVTVIKVATGSSKGQPTH